MLVRERITRTIQYQIDKHGTYNGMDNVEEVVNSLTNYELLVLLADYLEIVE